MKRKKIIVMGFMGSCPIAGVVWQHVHYIVGLQRLGHDVYYIEDSARLPYSRIRRPCAPGAAAPERSIFPSLRRKPEPGEGESPEPRLL
jgi:hypothetical protein